MGLNSANCSDVLILFHDVELVQLGYSKEIVKFLKYRTRLFTNQICRDWMFIWFPVWNIEFYKYIRTVRDYSIVSFRMVLLHKTRTIRKNIIFEEMRLLCQCHVVSSYCLLTSLPDYILCFQHLTLLPHVIFKNNILIFIVKLLRLFRVRISSWGNNVRCWKHKI